MRPSEIIAIAAELFDVELDELLSPSKARHVANVRGAIYWVLERTCVEHTMTEIAQLLGQRDRKSVYNGVERCALLMQRSATYRALVLELEQRALKTQRSARPSVRPRVDQLAVWALHQRGTAFVQTA